MKAKIAVILDECVDNGVDRGWARAHKHNESPMEIQIKSHIKECVMSQIYEYFSFEEGEVWSVEVAPAKTQELPQLIIMINTQRGTVDA